jgi:DNA-binding MarR family transcriptional regulator
LSKEHVIRQVADGLRRLQQSFDAFDEAAATALRLNRTDLRALDLLLAGSGTLAAGELSGALKLSPAATTTVIDRLERAGYARRVQDPVNRRRVLVEATEHGRDAERAVYGPIGAAGAEALDRYTSEELAVIVDFLRTARDVQEAHGKVVATGGDA